MSWRAIALIAFAVAEISTLARALLRPHRNPASRLSWLMAILVLPGVGIILYALLGEARINPARRARGREIDRRLHHPSGDEACLAELAESRHRAPFALASSVNKLSPTTGNSARLSLDSNRAIDEMVADIDGAERHAHGCFYIWLDDHNGLKVKGAFIRAAGRGVAVRLIADAFGTRSLVRSAHWRGLRESGCEVRIALPAGNPLWTWIRGRVDLRNHRKLLIVDNRIAWCGSQNIADPEFLVKPHYAPWVDIMTRWEGPVAVHCQYLFVSDWMGEHGDDISALLAEAPSPRAGKVIAQVLGTGPTIEFDAMPACFAELVHSSRDDLVVTTPYFVPDEQLLFALTSAARRGVRVRMIFPQRNDSRIVAGSSRSTYKDLLDAGVEIYEYRLGLLHAKTMVADGLVGLVGSANLDRRSFELNFENNILFADEAFAAEIRTRQDEYLADSDRVTSDQVAAFSVRERIWQNLLAILSPII